MLHQGLLVFCVWLSVVGISLGEGGVIPGVHDWPRTYNVPMDVVVNKTGTEAWSIPQPAPPEVSSNQTSEPTVYKFSGSRGKGSKVEYALHGRISVKYSSYGSNCPGYKPFSRLENAVFSHVVAKCEQEEFCIFRIDEDFLFFFSKTGGSPFDPGCLAMFYVEYSCEPNATIHQSSVCGADDELLILDCKNSPPRLNSVSDCKSSTTPSLSPSPSPSPSTIWDVFPKGSAVEDPPPEFDESFPPPYWHDKDHALLPPNWNSSAAENGGGHESTNSSRAEADFQYGPYPVFWKSMDELNENLTARNSDELRSHSGNNTGSETPDMPSGLHGNSTKNNTLECTENPTISPFHDKLPPIDQIEHELAQLHQQVNRLKRTVPRPINQHQAVSTHASRGNTEKPLEITKVEVNEPARTALCSQAHAIFELKAVAHHKTILKQKINEYIVSPNAAPLFITSGKGRLVALDAELAGLQKTIDELQLQCRDEGSNVINPTSLAQTETATPIVAPLSFRDLVRLGVSFEMVCEQLCPGFSAECASLCPKHKSSQIVATN